VANADSRAADGSIRIRGERLLLRAFRPEEIDAQWQSLVSADPMTIATQPDERRFRARLRGSGFLVAGWLDLAIDLDGVAIGRIQTFVPPERTLPPGTFALGIGLDRGVRGQGVGREAIALLTGWLLEHAGAKVIEGETDAANTAMRTVFERLGWEFAGPITESGREWMLYRFTR
jgi:RimJ/RimL family protein N-acetyltransferase